MQRTEQLPFHSYQTVNLRPHLSDIIKAFSARDLSYVMYVGYQCL